MSAIQGRSSENTRPRLPPDYERARVANEAVRSFEASHPYVPAPPRREEELGERTQEGGIPDMRFLEDPGLALGSGFLVADITFLSAGEPDDHALEETGRFRIQTTRYRVRLNGAARRAGDPLPGAEFDLFAARNFRPITEAPGQAPRMLAVLGDRSLRPGFNLKVAAPLSDRGELRQRAYGAAVGAFSEDLLRDLRVRAAQLPRRMEGAR